MARWQRNRLTRANPPPTGLQPKQARWVNVPQTYLSIVRAHPNQKQDERSRCMGPKARSHGKNAHRRLMHRSVLQSNGVIDGHQLLQPSANGSVKRRRAALGAGLAALLQVDEHRVDASHHCLKVILTKLDLDDALCFEDTPSRCRIYSTCYLFAGPG